LKKIFNEVLMLPDFMKDFKEVVNGVRLHKFTKCETECEVVKPDPKGIFYWGTYCQNPLSSKVNPRCSG
jgi:hypothetical protein